MEARYIIGAAHREQFPPEESPEVAFLGRSNVGKSSLLNSLLDSKQVARTSRKPGCTKLIHFYDTDCKIRFVDVPGYGYARVPGRVAASWKELVESYLLGRKSLVLAILLLDIRRGWMEKDLELKEWLEFHNRRHLVVATKTDKLKNRHEVYRGLEAIRKVAGHDPVPFSAVTGEGVREIWQAIWKTQNRA
ncbi:MAG TPA: ribosome biogenesis GTP-binding protein YihA/YsxC [Bryobacteraceae bacterium]|nr:ribosome biogenesis GTP-binding protein YihA/YsxC [Bryobacteraceae bacterium]HOL71152.1 ribosome biogenesis GTP-binding protein YihA/YsxC [Bryobacteraceae bacterium]HOQ47477.1 ribosome biogenesis GTP-binding protein YihA/YsxC [Bryobacteraceae bacterium]HPQ16979.1 ribosome biogenesis GTP-binding protein YihA/YsxC [Bryobacteraceae bacterium]HPU73192.1 ribosome biogenesis GTP-binding protein YihA/YsxC [Bryobacteraceae bacterium]